MINKIGVVIDSGEAAKIYHEATGEWPKPHPDDCPPGWTTVKGFRLLDEDGIARAAVLIHQSGFRLLDGERHDDANGLSLAIAVDLPADEGECLLEKYVDSQLWPKIDDVGGNSEGENEKEETE